MTAAGREFLSVPIEVSGEVSERLPAGVREAVLFETGEIDAGNLLEDLRRLGLPTSVTNAVGLSPGFRPESLPRARFRSAVAYVETRRRIPRALTPYPVGPAPAGRPPTPYLEQLLALVEERQVADSLCSALLFAAAVEPGQHVAGRLAALVDADQDGVPGLAVLGGQLDVREDQRRLELRGLKARLQPSRRSSGGTC